MVTEFQETNTPPKPAECDLVMKGGITSGIVYPPLVLKLADKYHFRNIGGTSAGAIAAAATAAAEYGREAREPDGRGGLEKLAAIQKQLSSGTFLRDLFQPTAGTSPLLHFSLDVMELTKRQSKLKKMWFGPGITWFLLRRVPIACTIGALIGLGLIYGLTRLTGGSLRGWGLIVALLWIWLGAVSGGITRLALILTRQIPQNFFGICTGRRDASPEEDLTVLTDWLNDRLNDLAGLKQRSKPLTFGDLRCKKFGDDRDNKLPPNDNIRLRMVTSNLSQNQPYVLPFQEHLFIFKKEEFAHFFPQQIVDYLIQLPPKTNDYLLPEGYYFLPPADDLPVIVATRLSLSFPILLSAVPLYTIKASKAMAQRLRPTPLSVQETELQVNWFSDGGIASNFPIHFFDAWLPTRPTFGVKLTSLPEESLTGDNGYVKSDYLSPTSSEMPAGAFPVAQAIYLPRPDAFPATEIVPLVDPPRQPNAAPRPNLLRFLWSIFYTAQSYRDNAQSVLPSYRERIVQIRLSDEEGGLNLAMPEHTIQEVIKKGEEAGHKLLMDFNFEVHQWVRLRVLMKQMEASLSRMNKVMRENDFYRQLLENPEGAVDNYPYLPEDDLKWLAEVATRLREMGRLVQRWENPELFGEEPLPLPEPVLRVTPEI